MAESGGEDLIGGFGARRVWGSGLSCRCSRGAGALQLLGGAMDERPDLFVGQQPEPALDRLSQEALVGVKWACQRGRLANQSRIALVLWVP